MRRVWVIALLTGSIRAADVTVFTTGDGIVPNAVSYGAKFQVTRMFAQIGVRLDWRDGEPSARGRSVGSVAIRAGFTAEIPGRLFPGVLAYAQPFDANPVVTVLYDRLQVAARHRPWLQSALLAHVLAHEIGHILQGTNAHAETGIMKANWTDADFDEMAKRPLLFTAFDEEMIKIRLHLEVPR